MTEKAIARALAKMALDVIGIAFVTTALWLCVPAAFSWRTVAAAALVVTTINLGCVRNAIR